MGQSFAKENQDSFGRSGSLYQNARKFRAEAFTNDNNKDQERPRLKPEYQKAVAQEQDWREIEDALDKAIFFSPVDRLAKRNIVQDMYEKKFYAGNIVIEDGSTDAPRALYVVKSGEFKVEKRNKEGVLEQVNLKQQKDVFGEISVLFDVAPGASVAASQDSQVWVLQKDILRFHLQTQGEFEKHRDVLFLNCCPQFQKLNKEQKLDLTSSAAYECFEPQDMVIAQGDIGDKFYIICEGEASAQVSLGQIILRVNTLFPTDYFGEAALLTNDTRNATVFATQKLKCLVITNDKFQAIKQHITSQDNFYSYARFNRRENRGWPSSIKAKVVIYRLRDQQGDYNDDNLREISKCRGHKEEVVELTKNVQINENKEDCMELVELYQIGEGAFAQVSVVYERSKGVRYAMKRIDMAKVTGCSEHVFYEQSISKNILNEFCLRSYASFKDNTFLYMLFDLMEGGDLMDVISSQTKAVPSNPKQNDSKALWLGSIIAGGQKGKIMRGLSENQSKFYVAQIIMALDYLHNDNILYRDLKPENVLLDKQGYIKLGDFGLSRKISDEQKAYTFCGTVDYVAPENIAMQGYRYSVDWWGLGVLIYVLLTGNVPFKTNQTESAEDIFKRVVDQDYQIQFPYYMSQDARNLISQLCDGNVERRQNNVQNIKKHPWFNTIDFKKIKNREIMVQHCPQQLLNLKRVEDLHNNSKFDHYVLYEDYQIHLYETQQFINNLEQQRNNLINYKTIDNTQEGIGISQNCGEILQDVNVYQGSEQDSALNADNNNSLNEWHRQGCHGMLTQSQQGQLCDNWEAHSLSMEKIKQELLRYYKTKEDVTQNKKRYELSHDLFKNF